MKHSYKDVLPEYPSVRHLPWTPNSKGDKIATEQEVMEAMVGCSRICSQEKIDGANCGMAFLNGHPVVRTRTKILRKGQELKNPSQKQFASAWNWMHDRKDRFEKLDEAGPYSVYGEWMVQQHGMVYDELPEWFIAYDLYDYEKQHFLDFDKADKILKNCGFSVIPFDRSPLFDCPLDMTPQFLSAVLYCFIEEASSHFANSNREGIVVKVTNGDWITHRFKTVRQGFDQGCLLGSELKRNKLAGT